MHVQNASEDLIDKVLDVFVREFLSRVDDSVHVSFHEIRDNIDVFKPMMTFVRLLHVK